MKYVVRTTVIPYTEYKWVVWLIPQMQLVARFIDGMEAAKLADRLNNEIKTPD